jgi:hypothetical protein
MEAKTGNSAGARAENDPKDYSSRPSELRGEGLSLITAEEVAKILKTSKWFVYQNRLILGGIKLGKLVRFDRRRLEVKINGGLLEADELALRLLERKNEASERRIPNQTGSQERRSRSPKKSKQDQYGLYRLMREQVKRPGEKED